MFFFLFVLQPMWSPAGKGLTSWVSCMLRFVVFVTFPDAVLGQVRYLNVSFPDLCPPSDFNRLTI